MRILLICARFRRTAGSPRHARISSRAPSVHAQSKTSPGRRRLIRQKYKHGPQTLVTWLDSQVPSNSVAKRRARGFPAEPPRTFIGREPMVHGTQTAKRGRVRIWPKDVITIVCFLPLLSPHCRCKHTYVTELDLGNACKHVMDRCRLAPQRSLWCSG